MTPNDRLKALQETVERLAGMLPDRLAEQAAALERIERGAEERAERTAQDEQRQRAIDRTLAALEENVATLGGGLGTVTEALRSFEGTVGSMNDAVRSAAEANADDRANAYAEVEGLSRQFVATKGLLDDLRTEIAKERSVRERRDPGPDIAAMREGMDAVRGAIEELEEYRYREGRRRGTWRERVEDWWRHSRSAVAVWLVGWLFASLGVAHAFERIGLALAPDNTRYVRAATIVGTGNAADLYRNSWALMYAADPDQYEFAKFGAELVRDNWDILDACRRQSQEATREAPTDQFVRVPCTFEFMVHYNIREALTRPDGSEPAPPTVPEPRTRPVR